MPTSTIHAITYRQLGCPPRAGAYRVSGLGLISIDASELAMWALVGYMGSAEVEISEGGDSVGYVTRILG